MSLAACRRFPLSTLTLITATLLHSTQASAISFSFTPEPGNSAPINTALNALAADVNSTFTPGMEDNFIKSMAEASRGTTSSLGTDGMVRGTKFSISTSAGTSFTTQSSFGSFQPGKNQLPGVGFGVQPAVTIGFNASKLPKVATLGLDPAKVDYFVHFMKLNLSDLTPEAGFSLTNFGLLGRYWIKDSVTKLWAFRWDGLSVTSGFQLSSMTANFRSNLDFTAGSGATAVSWAPNADFGIRANTFSIPLELRTGITLLKFWSIALGAGARFNFGSAQTEGDITGDILNGTSKVGTGTLNLDSQEQKPSLVSARFSLGNQFNFGPVKLFADAGFATPKVADLTLGLRFVW